MEWFFTALLIAVCAGTVGFACYLLRRLFTTRPAVVDVAGVDVAVVDVVDGLDGVGAVDGVAVAGEQS
ncbi:MAG TPA: hypothetical protein VGE11_00885 [Pseudonocardia sp.]